MACRPVGFLQVTGHAIPASTIEGLAAAIDDFFALPAATKSRYRSAPDVNRGYTPPRSESPSLSLGITPVSRMNDFFEAFNVGAEAAAYPGLDLPGDLYAENVWPAEVARFEDRGRAYAGEAARVAGTLTRIMADALGVAAGYFDSCTDHSLDVLRMNNYALPPGTVDLAGDLAGMSEHTDYGIVTVLWADQVAGLQVLGPDRVWHDVLAADGALLVNLGDLTARWTNDRWVSTLHRSAACFHDGNYDALVSAVPTCVAPGALPRYAPVTVAEHVAAKPAGSRAGRPNPQATREAARVAAAEPG